MDVAVDNLISNGAKGTRHEIKIGLLCGDSYETPHATFRLFGEIEP
jgi:hypothetical protein